MNKLNHHQPNDNQLNHQHGAPFKLSDVARFWAPLSLNWQLMAFEGPFIAFLISRLPDNKLNLAAFSIAFAWALIIESPVMGLLSVSAALSRDRQSFFVLRKFMWIVNGLATALMILFISPWGFNFIANRILVLDPQIAGRAHLAAAVMLLWPALIGFRRFYQGVSIAGGSPKRVAQGTVLRLISMVITGLLLAYLEFPGAIVGCGALIGAVGSEALAAWLLARPMIKKFKEGDAATAPTLRSINQLYFPLTITIFLGMALLPLATFALGRLSQPLDSLATYPVLNGVWFFFVASTLAIQETTIALMTRTHGYARPALQKFAIGYGALMTILLAAFSLSGLGEWWYAGYGSMPPELVTLLITAIGFSVSLPLLRSWECYQRALTVYARQTQLATVAAIIELLVILALVVIFGAVLSDAPGIYILALAIPLGVIAAVGFLWFKIERGFSSRVQSGDNSERS